MRIIDNLCFTLTSEGFFENGYVIDRTSKIEDHIGRINAEMAAEMAAGTHCLGITIRAGVVSELEN